MKCKLKEINEVKLLTNKLNSIEFSDKFINRLSHTKSVNGILGY